MLSLRPFLSIRYDPTRGGNPLTAASVGPSFSLTLQAPQIAVDAGAEILAQADHGFQGGDVTLTANDTAQLNWDLGLAGFKETNASASINIAQATIDARNVAITTLASTDKTVDLTKNLVYATDDVLLADLNGDGKPDLIVANLDGPTQVYLSNGTSTPFAGVAAYNLSGGADASSLAVGSLTPGGLPALIVGSTINGVLLYTNDGSATPFEFTRPVAIGNNNADVTSLALGDVTGDKLPDLIVGAGDGSATLWLNSGTATPFSGSGNVIAAGISGSGPALVALGNFTNASLPDLAVVNSTGSTDGVLQIYKNNSTGQNVPFLGEQPVTTSASGITALAVGNVNHDGFDDLVVAQTDSQGNSSAAVLINSASPPALSFVREAVAGTAGATSVALADVNGDGNLDLNVGSNGAPSQV